MLYRVVSCRGVTEQKKEQIKLQEGGQSAAQQPNPPAREATEGKMEAVSFFFFL